MLYFTYTQSCDTRCYYMLNRSVKTYHVSICIRSLCVSSSPFKFSYLNSINTVLLKNTKHGYNYFYRIHTKLTLAQANGASYDALLQSLL